MRTTATKIATGLTPRPGVSAVLIVAVRVVKNERLKVLRLHVSFAYSNHNYMVLLPTNPLDGVRNSNQNVTTLCTHSMRISYVDHPQRKQPVTEDPGYRNCRWLLSHHEQFYMLCCAVLGSSLAVSSFRYPALQRLEATQ